jgi:hypothetical protein
LVSDHRPVANGPCRLCGSHDTTLLFSLKVLDKYDVAYCCCRRCGSLQTEKPYWLEEAYRASLSRVDCGVAQRTLSNLAAALMVSRLVGARNVLDFGGGDGLLCRLLRDYGLNSFVSDAYATPLYAQAFTKPDFARPDLVLAFEVLEHLAQPELELPGLFSIGADVILATTELYRGQGSDWWYLTPESGQHVFFFSEAAVRLAGRFGGLETRFVGRYLLFSKPGIVSRTKFALLKLALNKVAVRLARAVLLAGPAPGVAVDFARLRVGGRPDAPSRQATAPAAESD